MKQNNEEHFKSKGGEWVKRAYDFNLPSIAFDRMRQALELVNEIKPSSILDVGCGDGRFLMSLPQIRRRLGLDHSDEMLSLASSFDTDGRVELAAFDFNDETQSLSDFGKFDLITMLGVIHYLTDPLAAARNLRKAQSKSLIITFRNRLFNIASESSYKNSNETIRDKNYLEKESSFWESCPGSHPLLSLVNETRNLILKEQRYLGLTDPGWNPQNLVHWRQFTPAEAIVLLEEAGFEVSRVIPLNLESGNQAAQCYQMLPRCTSFMILAN